VKQSFAEPVNFKAGDEVSLKVPVSGIPKPTATWTCNGKPIEPDGKTAWNVNYY